MKLLTANFVTCAVKTCKSSPLSFPLHFRDAELEQRELDYNPIFLANILPRLDWDAIRVVAAELGFSTVPDEKPIPLLILQQQQQQLQLQAPSSPPLDTELDDEKTMPDATRSPAQPTPTTNPLEFQQQQQQQQQQQEEEEGKIMRDLHTLLLETEVMEGKMVCGNCGHEYRIKEGIANFLLPAHLV